MSEDMLNVMGSFISTELDAFENLHKELEERDEENKRLKDELKKLKGELNGYKSIVYLCEKVKDSDKE